VLNWTASLSAGLGFTPFYATPTARAVTCRLASRRSRDVEIRYR